MTHSNGSQLTEDFECMLFMAYSHVLNGSICMHSHQQPACKQDPLLANSHFLGAYPRFLMKYKSQKILMNKSIFRHHIISVHCSGLCEIGHCLPLPLPHPREKHRKAHNGPGQVAQLERPCGNLRLLVTGLFKWAQLAVCPGLLGRHSK